MGDIIMNIGEFECQSPIVGDTFRNMSTTGDYVFNWTSLGDLYISYGMNVSIKLFILPEGLPPEQEYTDQPIPFNATNFSIGILNYDIASFRLEFSIDNGTTCFYSIDIPYSSIIIT